MRLAKNALFMALIMLSLIFSVSAQTLRSQDDDRNTAPTVGTGGPVGGPTGLFTIYDAQTLRRGEFTFSAAYSNFDRDPGNADITEVPVSFQIGVSDNLELFFNTDAFRGVKINSPRNLSSFYLPNSQFRAGAGFQSGAAIILAPGTGGAGFNQAVFRPAGAPFVQYPYTGGNLGNLGFPASQPTGPVFGFATPTATLGPPRAGGAADNFPGVGSIYGSILPGIVFATSTINLTGNTLAITIPSVYSAAPTYLPDAPFINRTYGQTAFSTFTAGAKWRFNSVNDAWGVGVIPFYRWYADSANSPSGFNQLQRGASPGGNRGDIGVIMFADSRIRKWMNVSGNVGYVYNSSVKDDNATLLDRPDELLYGVGLDFPVNKYFQPIAEFRGTRYMGGRTPNAFENDPMDLIAGVRIYPYRWMSIGAAYRYHLNQQDRDYFEKITFSDTVQILNCPSFSTTTAVVAAPCTLATTQQRSGNLANFVSPSSDPHGFIFQLTAGRRNARGQKEVENKPANVESLDIDDSTLTLPCPPGKVSRSGGCKDDLSTGVKTKAVDPEGDTLVYNYTVSGGRIVGQGANVNWDLSGVKPGTYTITAAVDDGCGFCGKTQTKTVTVTDCADCYVRCECPTLSVTGPGSVTNPGDAMTFTANVSGGTQDSVTYNWTVSNGNIIEGQGTPMIRVATDKSMAGQSVNATVNIGGVCEECPKQANESGQVGTLPERVKEDEFGKMPNDDVKARLDPFAVALQNDPTSTGYIINYGPAKQVAARKKLIMDYLVKNRGIDPSRLVFVEGGAESEIRTQLWRVPAGAEPPTPGM